MAAELPTVTTSWPPAPTMPISAPPQSPPPWQQVWAPSASDPYASNEPAPPGKSTRRLLTVVVVGLIVALLTAAGGYFLGAATSGKPTAGPSATPSPALPLFEANQKALNEVKFSGDLVPLAQPWLPYLGGCLSDTDLDGPKLLADETRHVFCRYGGVSVHFAQYKSEAAMNNERDYRRQLNQTTDSLAPGQQVPSQKKGGLSHAQGDYVEYALKGSDGRPLCGIWWNLAHSSGAMFMEALCHEVLADQWAPLRDLWQRYS
jgi:hypothetical protein